MTRPPRPWVAFACIGAAAAVCAPLPAQASAPAPQPQVPQPQDPQRLSDQALELAREAMARQEWAQAELLLERALMLRPESAEAMIELARLLAQRGRPSEALALLRALSQDPRTPPAQAQTLQALLERLEPTPASEGSSLAAAPAWPRGAQAGGAGSKTAVLQAPVQARTPGRWSLEALAGYSSNPLVVTSASSINLTLPDGTFQLPLEGRPRRAAYSGLTWAARADNGLEAVVQAQQVDLVGQRTAYRAALYLPLATLGSSLGGVFAGPVLISGLWRGQRFGDGSHRSQVDLQASQLGPWTVMLGWFEEPDRQRQGPVGRVEWSGSSAAWWQAAAWAEGEANRDAGAPGHVGLGARLTLLPAPAWSLHLQAQAQRDTSGYSQLLENNAHRVIRTRQISLEYGLAGNHRSPWRVRLYDALRISNLALFSWRDTGMQLIWRKSW